MARRRRTATSGNVLLLGRLSSLTFADAAGGGTGAAVDGASLPTDRYGGVGSSVGSGTVAVDETDG